MQRYSNDDMLDEIRRVANGGPLTINTYKPVGRVSTAAILVRFGTWLQALEAAGVESPYKFGGMWRPCPICTTSFRFEGGKKARITCSAACGNALRAQKLGKGRDATPQAARGRARKLIAIEKCNRCGAPDSRENRLEVHHIDRDPYNNDVGNLEVLCGLCHEDEHASEKDAKCRNGHPRTPANTYINPQGRRCCNICRADGTARFLAKHGGRKQWRRNRQRSA